MTEHHEGYLTFNNLDFMNAKEYRQAVQILLYIYQSLKKTKIHPTSTDNINKDNILPFSSQTSPSAVSHLALG